MPLSARTKSTPGHAGGPGLSEPMVRLDGVTKRFGDHTAVDGVDFAVEKGAFLTILGPSGSGKTTVLRTIAGFIQPDAGDIAINDRPVADDPPYARSIGMVFQRLALFPHMTAAENVAYPLKMRGWSKGEIPARVERFLELVRLDGLGTRRIQQLSGGQQQRVAIARALVFEPDLLLLDEPLAALDLLIEAEHGPDSSAFLVTDSRSVAEGVREAVPKLWAKMGEQRAGFTQSVLGGPRGGIVLSSDMNEAVRFTNDYAPEHLEVLAAEPLDYLGKLEHAGEILLGENTPVTLGNFVIGSNCVLPTGGHARTFSPLSVHDFMKRTSIAHVTRNGYKTLAPKAHTLATYEGFEAHANAISDLRRTSED